MPPVGAGFGMSVSFMDNGADIVSRDYAMDLDIVTYEAAALAAAAMYPTVIAVTDAVIPKYRVYQDYYDNVVIPGAGIQNENTASLTALLTGAGKKTANINIPAAKQALFVAASGPQANIVNTGNTELLAFIANFLVAGKFSISDGEEVARLLSGKRVHKKNNRG